MNYINAYLEEIESGRIKTSRRVYAVYKRLQKQQQSPPKGFAFYFDEEAGERPIEFIEKFCKQSQGIIGEPLFFIMSMMSTTATFVLFMVFVMLMTTTAPTMSMMTTTTATCTVNMSMFYF